MALLARDAESGCCAVFRGDVDGRSPLHVLCHEVLLPHVFLGEDGRTDPGDRVDLFGAPQDHRCQRVTINDARGRLVAVVSLTLWTTVALERTLHRVSLKSGIFSRMAPSDCSAIARKEGES